MASRTNFQLRDNSVRDCESVDSPSGGRNPPIPSQVGNVYTGWNPNHAPQGRPLAVGRMSGPSNDRANQIAGRMLPQPANMRPPQPTPSADGRRPPMEAKGNVRSNPTAREQEEVGN
jgi:hypothetical protein